jgi:hypothetical protein
MRAICLFILLTSFASISYSQADSLQPIRDWIKGFKSNGQVIYADRLSKYSVDFISSHLNKRAYTTKMKDGTVRSLKLSKKEHRYLLKNVKELGSHVFPNILFENSLVMPEDSILHFLKGLYEAERRKYDTMSLREKADRFQRPWWPNIFIFSKPIMLRNNSLMLLYTLRRYGENGGEILLSFYKKIDGSWTRWVFASQGYL